MENSQPKSNIVAVTIAKNESAEIAGWLDACRQFSCCQIVADTGSTDDTRELAERGGASVIDTPWADDFAAGRNLALNAVAKHPTAKDCPWIAMLDADEHITTASAEKLLRIIQSYTDEADVTPKAISITIINIDADDKYIKNREIHRFTAVRIFRNIPQLRYEGNIHEQLYFMDIDNNGNTIKRNPRTVIHPEIEVIHTGYSSKRVKEKLLRNLALLRQDIALHGEGPRHYRYLADCYHGLEDYAKSLRYTELAIASTLSAGSSDSDMHSVRLICMRKLEYPLAEQIAAAVEATDRFPRLPDFAAILGELQLQAEDYALAKENLQKSLALYNDYQQALAAGTINDPEASSFAAEPPNVHYRLAKCHIGLNNIISAKQEILTALAQRPQTIEYLTLAEDIFKDDFFDAIIIPSLSRSKDKAALISFYRDFAASLGALNLRRKICDLAGEYYSIDRDFDPLYELLANHRWAELLDVCENHAQENHHVLFLSALELAAREHNDEAKTAIAHLSVPAGKLISAIIAGNINRITTDEQIDAITEAWVLLASTVARYASAKAAVQFAALAPIIPPEASETLIKVGMLFYETDRMEAAAQIFSQLPALPELPPKEQDEISLIGQIDLSSSDIVTYISSIVSEEDYPELCRRLKGNINLFPSMAPVFIYFAGRANIPVDDDYTLLALGNYTAVAGRAAARLSQFTRLAIIAALKVGISATATAIPEIISPSLLQIWHRLEQGELPTPLAGHPQEQALLRLLKESSTQQAPNGQPTAI